MPHCSSSCFKRAGGGIGAVLEDMSLAVIVDLVVFAAAAAARAFFVGRFFLNEVLVESGDRGVTTGGCRDSRGTSGQAVGN